MAESQHGVVSAEQLIGLAVSRAGIGRRVAAGRLHAVHPGVYAVGHRRLTREGRLWAAVLACDGVLSHRTAGAAWEFVAWPPGRFELTTLARGRSTPAFVAHRHRLEASEITRWRGLPVTTPMRTLLDLATVLTGHRLERACHEAEHRGLVDMSLVGRGRRGARQLRTALASLELRDPQISRSDMEEAFLELVAAAGLPQPLVNARVEGFEVDFFWPAARLVVEADSRRWHLTPSAFEKDRRRDATLQLAGYRVLRFTYRQIVYDPRYVREVLTSARPS